jgi:type VI secretion system protein ImpK
MELLMHLTDCFMELVAYVVYFQKTVAVKQPSYEQVKADVLRLLTKSEDCLKKGLVQQDDYDQARFMICAWVDESILSSSWNQKGQWMKEQLQRLYYNTTEAGELVFDRLNTLGLHQKDVREVFYLCIALGFKGRFVKQGDEFLLDQLKSQNLKLLLGSSMGIPSLERSELFPEAYPKDTLDISPQKKKFRFSPATILGLAGPIVLFGLLFMIYYFSLNGIGENFLRTVQ